MKAFDLLSPPIQKYIRDQRWEELRPIQQSAIVKITTTENHYILAARTASGKTEAAFLPTLSMVDFEEAGVQILYISPLVALINDQFQRVTELCKYLDVPVTKWHGEANRSKKEKLVKNPKGILLITPESIEAIFVNKPYQVAPLFGSLKFIIIDEIHSFLGNHRGVQLKSLLCRIVQKTQNQPRFIGLSATLGTYYDSVKSFFGDVEHTKVLRDITPQKTEALVEYYESSGKHLPIDLLKRLYIETQKSKALIFPNSRGRVEEIAVKLKKIAEKNNGHTYYYAHHSSVNRELREFIERFVKTNKRYNYAIACTSTLELGIDIGSVDLVVQIDSTFSVASLAQRLGRSGRNEGTISHLLICATQQWSLLQSLACFQLFKKGFVEPLKDISFPIDILFHQILSIIQEHSGLHKDLLFKQISSNYTFENITKEEIIYLLKDMIRRDYLENINGELIVGTGAERLISGRTFYSVFQTPEMYQVVLKNKNIGEVPPSPQIVPGQNILLAAKMWTIEDVDTVRKKIHVRKALDGKKPMFFGGGGDIHSEIRLMMLSILKGEELVENCSEDALAQLNDLKMLFNSHNLVNLKTDRPLFVQDQSASFYTFMGTKVNRTIYFILKKMLEVDCKLNENSTLLEFPNLSLSDFQSTLKILTDSVPKLESFLKIYLLENEGEFPFSKWGAYLPTPLKLKVLLTSYFDIPGTMTFLVQLKVVVSD
jgi:ATP-dependent Lhr-like helicase